MNWQRAHRRSGTAGVRSRFESRVGHGALYPVLHTRPNQSIIPAWSKQDRRRLQSWNALWGIEWDMHSFVGEPVPRFAPHLENEMIAATSCISEHGTRWMCGISQI